MAKMQNIILESQSRELCGVIVRQRTKDSYFCLKDIIAVVNKWSIDSGNNTIYKPERYFALDSTKRFIKSLQESKQCEPYIRARGKSESWVHPHLMIDILLWANPDFKVVAYDWLMDYLIENRIKSSDSYVKMCGVLYYHSNNKQNFTKNIQALARLIKNTLLVEDWDKATKEQLELREYAHNIIADLANTLCDSSKGATLGIQALQKKIKG